MIPEDVFFAQAPVRRRKRVAKWVVVEAAVVTPRSMTYSLLKWMVALAALALMTLTILTV